MRNMFKVRPDWCVSRQRVWGVSIPVFYCTKCNEAVADPQIINRVADVFERESADAWYTREARELLTVLPEGSPVRAALDAFAEVVATRTT